VVGQERQEGDVNDSNTTDVFAENRRLSRRVRELEAALDDARDIAEENAELRETVQLLAGALKARKTYDVHVQNCYQCRDSTYCQLEIELDIDWMEKRDAALARAQEMSSG
jgi:hypothetical protein